MGSPFCSTCGGFIMPGSKHSDGECKRLAENNNQEYSNDTDTEQFKQPKRGWLVAYFQPIEDRDRFPNLHVYKCGHIDVAKGHIQAVIYKGTKWFSGIYVTFNQPYEKSGSKKELRLTNGILYHNVEKMSAKRPFDIPTEKVLRLSRDTIPVSEDKLEARLNNEWCLEREDSRQIISVIIKGLEL